MGHVSLHVFAHSILFAARKHPLPPPLKVVVLAICTHSARDSRSVHSRSQQYLRKGDISETKGVVSETRLCQTQTKLPEKIIKLSCS